MHRVTVAVFDGTLAELPAISIKEGVASCRDFRPDVIVGVGGSCMNKANLVSLLLNAWRPARPLRRGIQGAGAGHSRSRDTYDCGHGLRSDAGDSPWFLVLGLAVYGVFDLAQGSLARLANEHFDLIEDSKSSGRS